MKVLELSTLTSLLAVLACNGGSPPRSGCSSSDECASGLVCIVPSSGPGTCTAPPFSIQLAAPAQGAEVGPAGVDVQAVVTKADAGGPAPTSVALVVDGAEVGAMALDSQDGVTLRYRASYVPAAGVVRSAVIAAVAKTAGGSIASPGAIVSVDTKPPLIASAVATCGPAAFTRGACLRDEILVVEVSVTDDHPVTITASLDLPGPAVTAIPTGSATFYDANVKLGQYALPAFTGSATATATARDSFGNTATVTMPAVAVTRLRWVYGAGAPVSGPAVASNGNVMVGLSAFAAQARTVKPDGTEAWRATTGSSFVVAAPSVSAVGVWVGANDGKLYGLNPGNGFSIVTCPTGAAAAGALFTPAILTSPETAFTAGAAAILYGAQPGTPASCLPTATASTTDQVTTSSVIVDGKVFVATAAAAVKRFTSAPAFDNLTVTPGAGASTCADITGPLAATSGKVWLSCGIGGGSAQVHAIDSVTGSDDFIATLSSRAAESILVFPNGDLLVGTNDRKLHRLTPPPSGTGTWVDAWSPVPDLGAAVTGQAIASPDGAGVVAYAVTALGNLFAIDAAGKTVWSTATEITPPLGVVALSFPAIAPATAADGLPTLYTGSADGKLYAVIVDSGLDPTSPWPKSHHDLRNTGNAAAPLP